MRYPQDNGCPAQIGHTGTAVSIATTCRRMGHYEHNEYTFMALQYRVSADAQLSNVGGKTLHFDCVLG